MSYSHIDSETANALGSALDDADVSYFRDVKDIDWGQQIDGAVQTALEDSDALLVIVSPASLKSVWVPFEIGYFSAVKRPILPYLVHPSLDLPSYISNLKNVRNIDDAKEYFHSLGNQSDIVAATSTSAPQPDLRIRYSPALTHDNAGGFLHLVTIGVENHDINSVFLSNVSLLLSDGRRLQIVRDAVTGSLIRPQELRSGQRIDVRITRNDLADLRPHDIVGVLVFDQIGRQFRADPNGIQACIAELFRETAGT
jgi:hypothetical protein